MDVFLLHNDKKKKKNHIVLFNYAGMGFDKCSCIILDNE